MHPASDVSGEMYMGTIIVFGGFGHLTTETYKSYPRGSKASDQEYLAPTITIIRIAMMMCNSLSRNPGPDYAATWTLWVEQSVL